MSPRNQAFAPAVWLCLSARSVIDGVACPARYPKLTCGRFLSANLLPVSLGSMVGGSVLVGLVYWVIYLRPGRQGLSPRRLETRPPIRLASALAGRVESHP